MRRDLLSQPPARRGTALVLDEQRRVLLVKRGIEPNKGAWCLPIGFAETGETIAEAALRELHEETGVVGAHPTPHRCRLLDEARSTVICWWSLSRWRSSRAPRRPVTTPTRWPISPSTGYRPLAFASNEKAIRLCADLHRDDWAISDSFQNLENGDRRQDAL